MFGITHDCINVDPMELAVAPQKANDPTNPDANNGLITSIWGPPSWESFHAFTFGYPIQPTPEQQADYLAYFRLFGKVMPCVYCRESYTRFITEPATLLDTNTMRSRETLTRWGFELHNAVNRKLGVDYGDTYEELCYKYESYRARCTRTGKGCLMPLDMKAKSYQKAKIVRAPIIDKKYAIALKDHAQTLGLVGYSKYLAYYSKIPRNTIEWGMRDCLARQIIRYMRTNGIAAVDSNGLPSEYEMMLIAMLSTTLDREKLEHIYTSNQ